MVLLSSLTNFLIVSKRYIFQNSVIEMQRFFDLPSLNVIWQLVCGRRFEYNDQSLIEMIEHIEAFTMEKYIGPIVGTKGNYNISKLNFLEWQPCHTYATWSE